MQFKYRYHLTQTINNCSINGTKDFAFNVNISAFILCNNETNIKGQGEWVDYIWHSINNKSEINAPQLIWVPHTCSNVSFLANKLFIHFNVSFPLSPLCTQRRAWYDTLLGGLWSGIGIANSVDLEVLSSRQQNAGKDIDQSVNLNA